MKAEALIHILGAEFYTGVPDSQLKALCDYLMDTCGTDPRRHIIAANEGNCAALAAGYHLATRKTPAVYMQNSGEGNIINPVASLLSDRVYGIPVIFLIGWRGEPGIHDEPQHAYQGEVTLKLLEDMDIRFFVIGRETADSQVRAAMDGFRPLLAAGKSVAFVIKKGALTYAPKSAYRNANAVLREDAIHCRCSRAGPCCFHDRESQPGAVRTSGAERAGAPVRLPDGGLHGTQLVNCLGNCPTKAGNLGVVH